MNANEQLITSFYEAFQRKDYATMQVCYADRAVFSDEIFQNLDVAQTRAMWEMLIRRGKDLGLTFSNVEATATTGSAEWTAVYTFSQTKRRVTNHVKASFAFENGKITRHIDQFDFYTWSKQALGVSGLLLGWTGFMRDKVRQTARQSLLAYMKKQAV